MKNKEYQTNSRHPVKPIDVYKPITISKKKLEKAFKSADEYQEFLLGIIREIERRSYENNKKDAAEDPEEDLNRPSFRRRKRT